MDATFQTGDYTKKLFDSRLALTRITAIIIAAIIVIACIGGGAAYLLTRPSSSSTTTVNVITWGDWMLTGLIQKGVKQPLLTQFENTTGITVNFIFGAEDDIRTKIWLDATAHTGAYDIYGMDCYAVGQLAVGSFVDPLDSYVANKADSTYFPTGFSDFYQSTLDANTYNGKLYAMPTYCFGAGITYRADLFAKYNLTVPTTFDELNQTCFTLKADLAKDGVTGMYPLVMRAQKGEEPTIETTGITWAYGGTWFANNARTVDQINSTKAYPTFNSSAFVAGYDEYTYLGRNYGPPGMSDYSWYECAQDLAGGKAAMFLGFSAMYWYCKATTTLPLTDFGIARAPMGPVQRMDTFWTFSYFMNDMSKNKDATWEVLQLIASPQDQRLMAQTNLINTLPLKSLMNSPDIQNWTKTSAADMAILIQSFNDSTIAYAPAIPEYKDLCYMLGTAASQCISGQSTPLASLQFAEDMAMREMLDAGYYK